MRKVLAVDLSSPDVFAPANNFNSLSDLVNVVVRNSYVFAGLIAFVLIVLGGLGIIIGTSAGDPKQIEKGQKAVVGAVVGLILVVLSIYIVQLIEGVTGTDLLGGQ